MTLDAMLRMSFSRFADRVAIDADRTLTYSDLEREASALAEELRARGVGPGERVLMARPRGADAVVGITAILLAGGAYVPIDPAGPEERRRKIEQSCRPVAVLEEGVEGGGKRKDGKRGEGDPAAILYTSGSTGEPKGVCLSDRNLMHFVDWMVREFEVGPEDRLVNHAPYLFDLSIFDHFGAFRAGARVVPIPKTTSMFPASTAKFIEEKGITVWYSVPFALVGLAERGGLDRKVPESLRLILFAGEVFPMPSLRKLHRLLPGVEKANLFGPTETNVCTFHRLTEADLDREELPIGRAAPGFDLRVENEELKVRGPGVMKGYWGGEPVGEWYATGDRVEEREGLLWYRGRMDRMIKARGYRIEPGEVEAALLGDERVREAAVYAVSDDFGQKTLRAAVVLKEPAPDLQKKLIGRVPDYMIPARIRVLETLPRTATGKVDYKKLGNE